MCSFRIKVVLWRIMKGEIDFDVDMLDGEGFKVGSEFDLDFDDEFVKQEDVLELE